MPTATARREIETVLRERFGLERSTLQVDHAQPSVVRLQSFEGRAAG